MGGEGRWGGMGPEIGVARDALGFEVERRREAMGGDAWDGGDAGWGAG